MAHVTRFNRQGIALMDFLQDACNDAGPSELSLPVLPPWTGSVDQNLQLTEQTSVEKWVCIVTPTPNKRLIMKSKSVFLVTLLLACAYLTPAVQATVLRVVNVKTDDVSAYVKQIERGQAILKKMGSTAVVRVWRARFAGSDAGAVVVSIEYPDLVAFAAEEAKVAANAEYQAWLKGLGKIRTLVGDSIYEEITP